MRPRYVLALAGLLAAPTLFAQKPTSPRELRVRGGRTVEALTPTPAPASVSATSLAPALRLMAAGASASKNAQAARAQELALSLADDGSVRVLLEEAPASAGVTALGALGVVVEQRIGSIVVARVPVEALADVGRSPAVRRVEGIRRRTPSLAAARAEAGVDAVYAGSGTGLTRAYTGAGVVMGVVDSGLDLGHADFNTTSGTRVLAARADYDGAASRTFTRAQINANIATATNAMADTVGHGTHVTGIAAGGGRRTAANRGVAPGADIVAVRTNFYDDSITGGCDFVFQTARAAGKPAVCNLSLGGHYGPHDGTSLFERTISNLVSPGYLVVAAAGNEGASYIHAGGALTANKTGTAFYITDYFAEEAYLNGWFDANAVRTVRVIAYTIDDNDNLVETARTQAFTVGGSAVNNVQLKDASTTYACVSFDSETRNADNQRGQFELVLSNGCGQDVYIGDWYFDVQVVGTANGRFDVWDAGGSGYFYDASLGATTMTELLGGTDRSVAMPATARNVIAVGSYVTTNQYVDMNGDTQQLLDDADQPIALGSLATYSSQGPSNDGRVLPTISAPGEVLAAPLSSISVAEGWVYEEEVAQGGGYAYFGGTSMASPFTAGIVALMLEANPTLTFDQVSTIFATTARRDAFTGTVASNRFGAGKIDAVAAVREAARLATDVASDARANGLALDAVGPNPLRGATTVRFALDGSAPADLVVYDAIGREVARLATAVGTPGAHEATLDGSALAPGVYVVALRAGSRVVTRPVVVVR